MRKAFLSLLTLAFSCLALHAQEAPAFDKTFSLEIGTGFQPLHASLLLPSSSEEKALAEVGQEPGEGVYPTFSLTALWRTAYRWEMCLTGGITWFHYRLIQYEQFGIDPYGKPRYDLTKSSEAAGWKDSSPVVTLTFQARCIWNPEAKVNVYTAIGGGLLEWLPIPSLTPVGLRYGGKHIYAFVEIPFSPIATLVHGGLGWKF